MKKFLRPLGLALAFLLLTAGTYAAVSGESLISLGYLKDTFFHSAVKSGEEASDRVLEKALDDALDQLEEAHREVGGGAGLSSETLQRREWSDGQILTLSTGGTFVLLDGSATLVHTGAVVDVTTGTEAPSGSGLVQNHRYLVGENTDAAVTIRSGAAALGLQGSYTLMPGKSQHTPFYDVSQSNWYYAQVGFAYERGLFSGVDEHHFSANTAMNRAMLMSVLHRLAGTPAAAGDVSFTDVPNGQWYTQAVRWGASVGITSGTGNGGFSPNGAVTREQAVAMLYNYAYKYAGTDVSGGAALSGYGDLDRLSNWARPAMTWAVDRGIISGAANGGTLTLDPQRGATRAEMATMLKAFCEKIL